MYLANYQSEGLSICHGIAAVETTLRRLVDPDWTAATARAGALLRMVPDASWALRVVLNGDGELRQHILVTAPSSSAIALGRAFEQIHSSAALDGAWSAAEDAARYEAWSQAFPGLRRRVSPARIRVGGVTLAPTLSVLPMLTELLMEAETRDAALGFQVHWMPYPAPNHDIRDARRLELSLREQGTPAARWHVLIQSQVENLRQSVALCEEIVAADDPAALDWCAARIARGWKQALPDLPESACTPELEAAADLEPITLGLHRGHFAPLDLIDKCRSCVSEVALRQGLAWKPAAALLNSLHTARDRVDERTDAPSASALDIPPPWEGERDYLFISYRRTDLPRIAPVLRRLAASKLHYWYDKGIPGGAEWDALISAKVRGCRLFVVFESEAAMNSKWVRREIKFADQVDRPILRIRLEPTQLPAGLDIMLEQYQSIDAAAPDFAQEIERAIRFHRLMDPPGPEHP